MQGQNSRCFKQLNFWVKKTQQLQCICASNLPKLQRLLNHVWVSKRQWGLALMRMLHQATHRRGNQKKIQRMVTQKTWKQREEANRELLGSSCIWMKAHFIDANRPNEENGGLAWLRALATKLSRHQTHTFCKEHALAPFFFLHCFLFTLSTALVCEAKTSDQAPD